MAIEYTQVTGATDVASLPPGSLVAEVIDQHREKRFHPVNPVGEGTAASWVYPSIRAVEQVRDSEGRATGPVHLRLTPGLQDLANVMSPMVYVCDQNVRLTIASGIF